MSSTRRPAFLLAAVAALALALAPAIADARPGGRSSSGSRGSRTYEAPPATQTAPNAARPMDRTMTPPAQSSLGGTAGASAAAAGAARPAASRGFMGGMMGGLLGAGLIGALLGAGLFGGLGGFASVIGLLLQIGLVVGLVMLGLRLFRNRRQQPAYAGAVPAQGQRPSAPGANAFARDAAMPMGGGSAVAKPATMPFNPTPADFQAFEQSLIAVNAAWSARDAAALQRLGTPEMARHFAEDHAALQARGWQNETREVKLEQGDLSEAWHENGQDYATVAMRFSLIDVTRRVSDRTVVEGDPAQRITATELWTFLRPTGGAWQLAAIQQAE
ncbi:MAG TPA: TIM44-like domain-containing protein [Roseomonas sp.]